MSATTACTDNSGDVLSEEIAALNVRIDLLQGELDALVARLELDALDIRLDHLSALVSEAHETFRARLEALERGTITGELPPAFSPEGIGRIALVREDGPERLEAATNVRLDEVAEAGGTVLDVQAFSVNGWPMVLIGYRVPEGS